MATAVECKTRERFIEINLPISLSRIFCTEITSKVRSGKGIVIDLRRLEYRLAIKMIKAAIQL